MILPNKVNNTCCRSEMQYFHSIDGNLSDVLVNNIIDGFELSPAYEQVYKNYDMATVYKSWIYEGNKAEKIAGFKTFLSYPYEEIKFQAGDFISWKYRKNKVELSTWLVESFNEQHYFEAKGRILECNNKLKWKDNLNVTHSVDCVLMDNMTYINFIGKGEDGIVEPSASITVMTQQNDETNFIKTNTRFIFSDNVYIVKQCFRSLQDNFLKIFLNEVPIQQEDDFTNGIAWNGENIVEPIVSQNIILPDVSEISESDIVNFSVFKYVNGVVQADTFTTTLSGMSNTYYNFTIVDGNHFNIQCLQANKNDFLMVSCANNIDSTEVKKELWLTGGWI